MRIRTIAGLVALGTMAAPAGAQELGARVAAVRDGRVTLHYTPRPGVCGDGRTFVRIGENQYHGHWDGPGSVRRACEPGPVRVEARVEGGRVRELRSFVGPARDTEAGATDLGAVPAPAAARWLLEVARTGDASAAKGAIFPAVLADSAVVWRELLAIARDTDGRPRGVRNDAAFWLSRFASAAASGHPERLDEDDDDKETEAVRAKKEAVFALSQLHGKEGVPALVQVARTHREPAVRGSALFWLGQSGDPRALALFEEVLSR